MNCELCGKKQDADMFRAVVEGAELKVCANCGRFGKIIGKVKLQKKEETRKKEQETPRKEKSFSMVPGYGALIKKKREQLGMSQEEFAKKLAEKESIIHKIEVQAMEPGVELAAKLEKLLVIKLIEETGEDATNIPKPKKDELTLGDFVKVRKRH